LFRNGGGRYRPCGASKNLTRACKPRGHRCPDLGLYSCLKTLRCARCAPGCRGRPAPKGFVVPPRSGKTGLSAPVTKRRCRRIRGRQILREASLPGLRPGMPPVRSLLGQDLAEREEFLAGFPEKRGYWLVAWDEGVNARREPSNLILFFPCPEFANPWPFQTDSNPFSWPGRAGPVGGDDGGLALAYLKETCPACYRQAPPPSGGMAASIHSPVHGVSARQALEPGRSEPQQKEAPPPIMYDNALLGVLFRAPMPPGRFDGAFPCG